MSLLNIKEQKSFLNENDFKVFKSTIFSDKFPWFISGSDYKDDNNKMLSHVFYIYNSPSSKYYNLLEPFFEKLEISSLVRAKLNLTSKKSKNFKSSFHKDIPRISCLTSIFYINTNDGGTEFENGKFIKSEENKIVTFPSQLKHRVVRHKKGDDFRIVLNLNYYKFDISL